MWFFVCFLSVGFLASQKNIFTNKLSPIGARFFLNIRFQCDLIPRRARSLKRDSDGLQLVSRCLCRGGQFFFLGTTLKTSNKKTGADQARRDPQGRDLRIPALRTWPRQALTDGDFPEGNLLGSKHKTPT